MAHEETLKHLHQAQKAMDQLRAHLAEAMKAAEAYGKDDRPDGRPSESSEPGYRSSLMGRGK